jgi:hypothetical protein
MGANLRSARSDALSKFLDPRLVWWTLAAKIMDPRRDFMLQSCDPGFLKMERTFLDFQDNLHSDAVRNLPPLQNDMLYCLTSASVRACLYKTRQCS